MVFYLHDLSRKVVGSSDRLVHSLLANSDAIRAVQQSVASRKQQEFLQDTIISLLWWSDLICHPNRPTFQVQLSNLGVIKKPEYPRGSLNHEIQLIKNLSSNKGYNFYLNDETNLHFVHDVSTRINFSNISGFIHARPAVDVIFMLDAQ